MVGRVKVDKHLQLKTRDQKPETTVFVSSSLLCDLGKLLRAAIQFLLLPMGVTSGHGAHEALCILYPATCLSQWVPVLLSLFDIRVGSLPTSVLSEAPSPSPKGDVYVSDILKSKAPGHSKQNLCTAEDTEVFTHFFILQLQIYEKSIKTFN